ncbi:MAG: glycoside hydrolase family 13 protein [Bacillota bacterium]|jgi:cyclomaltodextrinase
MILFHNSHDLLFRAPFGAVPCGTKLTLRLQVTSARPPEAVILNLWTGDREENISLVLEEETGDHRLYGVNFSAPQAPGHLWYYFFVRHEGKVFYFGNNRNNTGGRGEMTWDIPPRYQITIYSKKSHTPAWFKETVVYQIFVDRFYRKPEDKTLSLPPQSLLHVSWDDFPFYIRDPQTHKVVQWDFFGGNLAGVMEKLSYLQELGVGCIYFNPIFHSHSNHKYDTGDYKNIDPGFGGNEIFARLCQEAKTRGINIILDGVFSHTGSDSIYFNKRGNFPSVGAYQSKESPYYSWFRFIEYPEKYESWWGVESLPNVNELNPSYQNYMFYDEDSVIKHWLKAGIKGWRLDVADELPDEFIQKLRTVVKTIDLEAVVIGEVWEDASHKISYGVMRRYFFGDELDSVTNYPFRAYLIDFFLHQKSTEETYARFMSLYENYPRENFYALLNMAGSHDVPRILTVLGEAPPEESLTDWERANYRLPEKNRLLGVKRVKLFSLVQITFPGVPLIYYGDEVGMEGYDDPYNRGTFPWGKEDQGLLAWYRKLINLRNQHDSLKTGEWHLVPAGEDIFCFIRQISGGKDVFGAPKQDGFFLIAVNRNEKNSKHLELDLRRPSPRRLDNLLDEENKVNYRYQDGFLLLDLPPLAGVLFMGKDGAGHE